MQSGRAGLQNRAASRCRQIGEGEPARAGCKTGLRVAVSGRKGGLPVPCAKTGPRIARNIAPEIPGDRREDLNC